MVETKTCTKCGSTKPLSEFHKDKSKPDGHCPRCKECKIREVSEYIKNNPEKVKEANKIARERNQPYIKEYRVKYKKRLRETQDYTIKEFKTCPRCKITKPINEFNINKSNKDGHSSYCKPCSSIRDREYRRSHPTKPKVITKYHWIFITVPYDMRICRICGEMKDISCFRIREETGMRRTECNECMKEIRIKEYNKDPKRWAERNKAWIKAHPEEAKQYSRNYHWSHREEVLAKAKKKLKENTKFREHKKAYREAHKEERKQYLQENKDAINEQRRAYYQTPNGNAIVTRSGHKRRNADVPNTLTFEQWMKIIEQQNNKCLGCGKRFTKKDPATRDHIVPIGSRGGLTFENVQALCRSCNTSKKDKLDHENIVTWLSGAISDP